MLSDFFCTIVLFGFFGFLIYSILTQPKRTPRIPEVPAAPPTPPPPPSPVQVCCVICDTPARTVSREEYLKLEGPVYCYSCLCVIEAYKARTQRS